MYQQFIDRFLRQQALPDAYRHDIDAFFLPLAEELAARRRAQPDTPLVVGINGAQGTGKSTLAQLLTGLLTTKGMRAVALSLDDFYLPRAQRVQLALDVHPLLASRGVPGTHDVALALDTLNRLATADRSRRVPLPSFDKATDDQRPPADWPVVSGPLDLIVLEGWCVGAQPQAAAELVTPINGLEREEDSDGSWRGYVNAALGGDYQALFARLDLLLMLRAPDFEQVYRWRGLQEEKLRQTAGESAGMDSAQLARFISLFERLTRHCLNTLPLLADTVFYLDTGHTVVRREEH